MSEDNHVEPPNKCFRSNEEKMENSDDLLKIGNLSINEKGLNFINFENIINL